MKKIIIVTFALLLALNLIAEISKVAVLPFQKNDSKSSYVANSLNKRDFERIFKDMENYQLIDMEQSQKLLEESGYTNVYYLGAERISEFGKKLDADIVVWGRVSSVTLSDFKIDAKIMSMVSHNVNAIQFNVTKKSKERREIFKEKLVPEFGKFGSGEVEDALNIALQYFKTKNYEAAKNGFERVKKLDPQNVESYFYLGYIYFVQDNPDYQKSVEYYKQGLEIDPKNKELLKYLGAAYLRQEKNDQALDTYKKLANISNDKEVWYKIGTINEELGRYDAAKEAYLKATNIDPEYCECFKRLAEMLYDIDMFDEAIVYFENAVEAYPDDESLQKKLAKCYYKADKLDQAVEQYKTLIEQQPDNIKAYLNLAGAYRILNNNEKTLEVLEEMKEKFPENPKVYYRLADAYVGMGEFAPAEENAKQAIELNADLYEPYKILAQVYQMVGYKKYEDYLELDEKAKNAYGTEADKLVEQRDSKREAAHNDFLQSSEYLDEARNRTNDPGKLNDIAKRKETINKLLDATKKEWF